MVVRGIGSTRKKFLLLEKLENSDLITNVYIFPKLGDGTTRASNL